MVLSNELDSYELITEIGIGASAVVWEARCKTNGEKVAIKICDLDKTNTSLDEIRKEVRVITNCKHPNIIQYYGSFVKGHELWLVMELLDGGSLYDIMRYAFPNGLKDEDLIAAILKQVLQGLAYFHQCQNIHRDLKASNLLLDKQGNVRIADFGVSAAINGGFLDRRGVRQTFVGTPCWMAPEVMEQVTGYDYKADIWSFGITALELANGHAPFAKFPPMKVLLMTLQNEPPTVDSTSSEGGKKSRYSSKFKEVVNACLKKEPSERLTAEKLLEKSFFKGVKKSDYISKCILSKIPPLHERTRRLREQLIAEKSGGRVPASLGWDFPSGEPEQAESSPSPQEKDSDQYTWNAKLAADYTQGEEIGRGQYKAVFHAIGNRTGHRAALHEVAIKTTDSSSPAATDALHKVLTEVLKLHHPHVVSILDIWETTSALWYATDFYGGGSLKAYVIANGPIPDETVRHWTLQLINALLYLHAHNVIHRSVSTSEVLLTADDTDVVLCETILWNIRDDPRFGLRPRQAERYLAPEHYDEESEMFTEQSDVYSLGMVVLEMCAGDPPYSECKNAMLVYRRVSQGIPPEAIAKLADPQAQAFIRRCIALKPEDRGAVDALRSGEALARRGAGVKEKLGSEPLFCL